MVNHPVAAWHKLVEQHDPTGLNEIIAEDAVFHSPVVHTPQVGKDITVLYLSAAFQVLFNDTFTYVREVLDGKEAVLEFQVELDGIMINGVDMIRFDENGKISDFKVMIRPLKAINKLHEKMGEMLQKLG